MRRSLTALPLLVALLLVARGASAVEISLSNDEELRIEGSSIWIHPAGRPAAEVRPGGELRIDGRTVALRDEDRHLLSRYNDRLRDIRDKAVQIGFDGVGVGISALAGVIVAVATGHHDYVEHKVEPDASRLKERARALCQEVHDVRRLQDSIAARVAAFRPYAVMGDSNEKCHVH